LASLSRSRSSVAAGPDEAGFWPVISRPSVTAALRLKFVLYEKGHHMGQPHSLILVRSMAKKVEGHLDISVVTNY
jgi:hypothetical protein